MESAAQKPLIERLNFLGNNVYLDGELIFTTFNMSVDSGTINVLGAQEFPLCGEKVGAIDIGTGPCCYGYFYRLQPWDRVEPKKFQLNFIRPAEFNIYDLLPAGLIKKESDFLTPDLVLATGYGCEGSGVRLMGTHHPRIRKDIVSGEEFKQLEPLPEQHFLPRFRVSEGRVHLDLVYVYRMQKPGQRRDPKKPSILADSSEESYVSRDVHSSIDLTKRLEDAGIDIPKTLEFAKDYRKIYSRR